MTRLSTVNITCPCGNNFTVVYEASINTWLSSSLIEDFLNGKLYRYQCKKCGKVIQLVTKILINAPSGMLWISTDEDPETLRKIFKDRGIIDENGKAIDAMEERFIKLAEERKQTAPEDTKTATPAEIRKELEKIFKEQEKTPSKSSETFKEIQELLEKSKAHKKQKSQQPEDTHDRPPPPSARKEEEKESEQNTE